SRSSSQASSRRWTVPGPANSRSERGRPAMTIRSTILAPLKIALCLSLTFAGVPGFDTGFGALPAQAAQSMIRISQVGPGVNKKVKLGLNKAVVIDLPTDAHDILVA